MKCQKCKNANANTHIKTIVNGEFREFDLCGDCAKSMGYTNIFSSMEDDFSNLLGSFFSTALPARTQATRCDFCGCSYADIARTGQVGCEKCYEIFGDRLLPTIRRIHGNTTHCGKNSPALKRAKQSESEQKEQQSREPSKAEKIENLKSELKKAVKEQNFEYAAELRDKISEMEAE